MKIAFAQVNPTVGDIAGNAHQVLETVQAAKSQGVHLVLFPELMMTGYPPEDLLLKPSFVRDNVLALREIAKKISGIAAVVGFVDVKEDQRFNACAWIENGTWRAVYHKQILPNYGVFDEDRYFTPGRKPVAVSYKGFKFSLTICEDIWTDPKQLRRPAAKSDLILNISASPFHVNKDHLRKEAAARTARHQRTPLAYCNLMGGQDELVFDGGSFVVGSNGQTAVQKPFFKTGLFSFELKREKKKTIVSDLEPRAVAPKEVEQIHQALVLGLKDYVTKNGFGKVALGVSGGIDSALVAALATEALGKERVIAVTMPSRHNSSETRGDAQQLAENLGIRFLDIPIEEIYQTYLKVLKPQFEGTAPNIAEENLQARVRGTMLMALSNKFGWLILTTGNKSEMSTGYCTLYGDTAGGFAVIKDLVKSNVYALANYINERAGHEVIPQTTIDRPPTAELRDNQKDEDSLGPYAQLDPVVIGYVERNQSGTELYRSLHQNKDYVKRIISLIDKSEYKRRQAPPGIKITPRSFGRDHRMPITNRYTSND